MQAAFYTYCGRFMSRLPVLFAEGVRGTLAMGKFSKNEWSKIKALLRTDGGKYGFPERRDDSVLLASFNIRKLGKVGNKSADAWTFLGGFCAACDLIAIQEVQDDLSALNHLKGCADEVGGDGGRYGLVASDITGGNMPAGTGLRERLAFLFRWDRVERTEVASDITIDRSAVLDALYDNRADFSAAFETRASDLAVSEYKHRQKLRVHREKLKQWRAAGSTGSQPKKPAWKKPPFVLPHFVTFIRTPHCVSFRIGGKAGAKPYEFLALNAHLLYGHKTKQAEERRMEFFALVEWLAARAKNVKNLYHKDLVLFGDLNLDFDDPGSDRKQIDAVLTGLNKGQLTRTGVTVNFPLLSVHPSRANLPRNERIFRTNARQEQTYDQIALFIHDKRLPGVPQNAVAGTKGEDEYDYGVFNFVDLFAEALHGKPFKKLADNQKKSLLGKFEHDVSDHMPIWIRLPLPK